MKLMPGGGKSLAKVHFLVSMKGKTGILASLLLTFFEIAVPFKFTRLRSLFILISFNVYLLNICMCVTCEPSKSVHLSGHVTSKN